MRNHILILEDDLTIASGLMYALEKEGYQPYHCKDVKSALLQEANTYDLAILDMQLPDGNGCEVGRLWIQAGVPVIYLTIVDDENEIVQSLEEGAADYYITKPFRLRELLVRVKRSLNKNENIERSNITFGEVVIDTTAGKVYVRGSLVEFTALEYRLLLIFATHQSILLSREQILEKIWDVSGNYVEDNTLTVYMKRLREKLGDAAKIETVRGMGYRAN